MTIEIQEITASPTGIIRLGTLFCESKAALSAIELGLFTVLDAGPADEPEIRRRLGLQPRGIPHFLNLLVTLGLLEKEDGVYRNSAASAQFLVRTRPGYVGGFLEGAGHQLYPAWGRLTEALRSGEPQAHGEFSELIDDPAGRRGFLAMMDSLSGPLAPAIAKAIDWDRHATLTDVGGARGNMVGNLLQVHEHLTGTVFDRPAMEPDCYEHMTHLGVRDRVRFVGGDFFADPLPETDVMIMGHVLADWSAEQRRLLIGKAGQAVRPGGVFLIYDPIVDENRPNMGALIAGLHMLLMTDGGSAYTVRECHEWLAEAGFTCADPPVVIGERDTLVIGRKPA